MKKSLSAHDAIVLVESLCGGDEGFSRVLRFIGDDWDKNLEDFCLQRQSPDEYVRRAKAMLVKYNQHQFDLAFEKRLVDTRERK